MILEHDKDPVSARWDNEANKWSVGEKTKYRWNNASNKPESEWFYDISDALQWIKKHDENR
jgi:hypothetical protein